MNKTTSLAALKSQEQKQNFSVGMTDSQGFELAQRAARLLSSSSLVPKNYQGNIADCVIALNMANRVGADPLMVMQNLVIVHGRPTWSSQFLISTVNTCGRFSALRYEFFGEKDTDTWGCRAWAIEKATGEKLVGTDITIKLAKDEGWYGKNGSKWKTMPQQMLMYRAGSWWARAYAPELSMGLTTAEELQDVIEAHADGSYTVTSESLRATDAGNAEVIDMTAEGGPVPVAGTVNADTGEVNLNTKTEYANPLDAETMIVDATSLDELYEAQPLIDEVDPAIQPALKALFNEKAKKFE